MKKNTPSERLINGIIKENPTFVLMLGMCPTLAITTSAINGIGMGLGFTLSITCIGAVRELIGAGSIFGKQILPLADAATGKMGYEPVTIFILAPGAFFVLAFLSALQNKFKIGAAKRGIDPSNPDCKGGCASCGNSMCSGKRG